MFSKKILVSILAATSVLLSACGGGVTYAPVTEISTIDPIPENGTYRVMSGDTLYSIAWRYGKDYRSLAVENNIEPPYHVYVGQPIHLRKHIAVKQDLPAQQSAPVPIKRPNIVFKDKVPKIAANEPAYNVTHWQWPSKGRVVRGFSSKNKGVDIVGRKGQAVYATAAAKVVYSGDGLRSYGNLIILKHNSRYLSAYAYNRSNLVREGDWVKSGQKIAEMGIKNNGQPTLHFEIRRAGKPLNPLKLLTKQQ